MNFNYYPPPNGYPPVNAPVYPPPPQNSMYYLEMENQKRGLRKLSITAGLCVLGFIVLQFVVMFGLSFVGLTDAYQNNTLFQNSFGAVISVICVFLPFFIVTLFMDTKKRSEVLLFGKPHSTGLMLLAVPIGFLFCMVGNYATSAFISLMGSAGVTLTAPDMAVPATALGMVMYVVQIAFFPPLVEEFALRGVVMQPLRKYGDRFAIVMSSLIFALMHGNMVQAPFAFIAGIAIGYLVIATGSLWTGVLIHFANNLFSSLFTLASSGDSKAVQMVYAVIMTVTLVAGLACCVLFAFNSNRYKLLKPEYPMRVRTRLAAYIFTVPMLLALIAILYLTSQYIKLGG